MKTVNVYSHVVLPEFMGAAGKYGPWFESTANGFIFKVGDYELVTKTRAQVELVSSGQKIDAAHEELIRCVRDVGVRGINLGATDFGGRQLDDEALFPIWEEMERLNVPLCMIVDDATLVQERVLHSFALGLDLVGPMVLPHLQIGDQNPGPNPGRHWDASQAAAQGGREQ